MTVEYEYRKDGWPLCPRCGDDELMSLVPIDISIFVQPSDRMRCLACRWEGFIPPRPLPSSSGASTP